MKRIYNHSKYGRVESCSDAKGDCYHDVTYTLIGCGVFLNTYYQSSPILLQFYSKF